ncbi:rod shape-determining protein MreC [Granulicella pectinivorans]|uniref:Cell shape-determining protein MreC n=1 Tax=Granulicella pectinivorans TaxID=474950 RepID=A0A1I6LYM2_9BACT|nr:rod shape-determining protein MreC [Granulicella pectinivorans]SFS08546.1 rod shape-determining protein MreC [Granulicella pectinivorans]
MESFFSRYKNALVLIGVLLAQTIGLAMQVQRVAKPGEPDSHQVRLLRLWAASVVVPLARTTHFFSGGIRGGWSNYVALWHVRQQNEELRKQLADIRLQQAAQVEDILEGRRLQALVAFREHYISSTVAAQVIGTSGTDQSRMLLIDKGADAGLRPDMPVITPDGIVGKLRDVFPHSAQLLLISDQTAGAGVILESTRIRAILKGTPSGRIQIGNLTADSRIQPGEKVLTSGGDQVYPRGLPVGTVESIAPDPDHQPYTAIVVHPAAKLTQLEEVLVITGMQQTLPAQAAADLAAAEVQHAADLDAAAKAKAAVPRGLDLTGADNAPIDPNAPVQPAPAENAPGLVPKPAPALHPDRYTYGTAPPATDLTPGAKKSADPPPVQPPPAKTPEANL